MDTSERSELRGDILEKSLESPDPRDIPALVTRYVHQMINGCGNTDGCTEVLCRTGLRNTGKPVRDYTVRSARTIAIAMAASPNPRSHLCRYATAEPGTMQEKQTPSDPSALDQQLCETRAFKRLQEPDTPCFQDVELNYHHDQVTMAIKVVPDEEFVQGLAVATNWLLAKLPHNRPASYAMVNDLISKGYAYPTKNTSIPADDNFNSWLRIVDTVHHKPYLRLLGRVAQAIGARQASALTSRSINGPREGPPCGSDPSIRLPSTACDSRFTKELLRSSPNSPNSSNSYKIFALVVWLKRLAAEHWDGRPEVKVGSICMAAWTMVNGLANHAEDKFSEDDLGFYHMPMIWIRLSAAELVQSYRASTPPGPQSKTNHILELRTLFSMKQLTLYFRMLNHLKMREANSATEKSINLMRRYTEYFPRDHLLPDQLKHATNHYMLLNVSRGNVLEDAFDQLWQRRKDELKRPLRVRLGEIEEYEVGHDLGGVQVEFFNLVCKESFSLESHMFVTDEQTGLSYFRPASLQPLHMFELLGLLVALALYNGITLPISLPRVFYRILAGYPNPPTACKAVEELRDGWPVLARSMESVLDDDVPDLEYTFPFEVNGIRMQILSPENVYRSDAKTRGLSQLQTDEPEIDCQKDPQKRETIQVTSTTPEVDLQVISEEIPGWKLERASSEPEDVTLKNKECYVMQYAHCTIYHLVSPQWKAFERGFWNSELIEQRHLRLFSPCQLKSLIEGTSHLDITALRYATQYDGYSANDPYMHMFWRVVGSWSEAKQKQLLKFVTAAERIPITGGLTFVIKRYESENSERLPTSSTCFGTLMLPVYRSERVLGGKLSLALRYGSEGFGTG